MPHQHQSTSKPGLRERLAGRFTRTEAELEADELQQDADRLGGTPIAELADRSEVSVCGAVRSVTLRPRVNVPALVGRAVRREPALNLVWLGRRSIGGIEPGTYLTARGRVTYENGVPTIFNPAYDIRPNRGL